MTVPFIDAEHPEVVARVAVAMIRRAYFKNPDLGHRPVPLITTVIRTGCPPKMTELQCALMGLQYHVISRRGKVVDWLSIAVAGSRLGYTFRQCFYADYKASRRR